MGALEGSLSFKTYYVEGEPPNDFQQNYLERLKRHFFQPLSPVGEDERTIGWVPVQETLAMDLKREQIFFNEYIVFGLRIDKWSIPTAWLKARMNQVIAERYPDPEKKISKRIKNEIRLEVTTDIKQHIIPAMKVIDVVWNITERKLRFWSTSKNVCEEFIEFFEDTFDITLTPDSPFTMAEKLGLTNQQLDQMVDAEPWHPVLSHAKELNS